MFDEDNDGVVTAEEYMHVVSLMDKDGDGKITTQELRDAGIDFNAKQRAHQERDEVKRKKLEAVFVAAEGDLREMLKEFKALGTSFHAKTVIVTLFNLLKQATECHALRDDPLPWVLSGLTFDQNNAQFHIKIEYHWPLHVDIIARIGSQSLSVTHGNHDKNEYHVYVGFDHTRWKLNCVTPSEYMEGDAEHGWPLGMILRWRLKFHPGSAEEMILLKHLNSL
eukprot:NODE_5918_length_896_cov_115.719276_g5690_i0.p1 GENE.NODE_5918_length_896_cov_115.719276_g5690_i0~~NODE_5918_length_896_cov_115.719276_g5690_i0.p1  ORF type:complete len:223 (-),score=42.78 NODE_5918_length_896_cov_115.719276_g5690_i0:147-815(-)